MSVEVLFAQWCGYLPCTDHSTGKSLQLLTAVESVKQDLHRLDQYQATLMIEEPPEPPIELIFHPSMAIVQAIKIHPRTVIKKPQIWTTRIFILLLGHQLFCLVLYFLSFHPHLLESSDVCILSLTWSFSPEFKQMSDWPPGLLLS